MDTTWEAQSPGGSCGQFLALLVLLKVTKGESPWEAMQKTGASMPGKKSHHGSCWCLLTTHFIPFLAPLFIEVDNRSLEIRFCLKQRLTSSGKKN